MNQSRAKLCAMEVSYSSYNIPEDSQEKWQYRHAVVGLCCKKFFLSFSCHRSEKNTSNKESKACRESRASFEDNSKLSAVLSGKSLSWCKHSLTFKSCATDKKAPEEWVLEVKPKFGDKLSRISPLMMANVATVWLICPRKWVCNPDYSLG